LDAYRVVIDVESTGRLAWSGADASGELREVVGRVQHTERGPPVLAIDQIVPVGNDIVDWAAVAAEGNAAIHATRALHLGLFVGQRRDELLPVLKALSRSLVGFLDAFKFYKAGDFAHFSFLRRQVFRSLWRAIARPGP